MTELEKIRIRANAYCGLFIRLEKEVGANYIDVIDIAYSLSVLRDYAEREGGERLTKKLDNVIAYLKRLSEEKLYNH